MKSTFDRLRYLKRSSPFFPDLGPWAGVLLALCFVFMFAAEWLPVPTPFVHTPSSTYMGCRLRDNNYRAIISVDADNRFYLAAYNDSMLLTAIKQVAKQHHVSFTTAQLQALRKLPFLSQDIRQVPAWLSATAVERLQFPVGIPATPDNNQIAEYIAATIRASETLFRAPASFELRLDGSLSAAQVKRIFRLLQDQGVNYMNLVTEMKVARE